MIRVLFAFLLAPFLVSILYGKAIIIAMIIMYPTTLIAALPLFFIFKELHFLNWWHVTLAGALCSVLFLLGSTFYFGNRFEDPLSTSYLFATGSGALIGLLFWFIGIYQNPLFPYIATKLPKNMLVVIPIAIFWLFLYLLVDLKFSNATIVSMAQYSQNSNSQMLKIKLDNGEIVDGFFLHSNFDEYHQVYVEGCYRVVRRWSTRQFRHTYEIVWTMSRNDCAKN